MKCAHVAYARPGSLDEAFELMAAAEDPAPLAGGQSLMAMMNFRLAAPGTLVDLNRLPELRGIARKGDWLEIGAMTRYAELARAPQVAAEAPLLARALPHVAHAAIRNRGTIGGSVALADPAAELPAVLLALGAEIVLGSHRGRRTLAADDFFEGLYETARAEDELVLALCLPAGRTQAGFHELARRHGDYAMAGAAVSGRGGARWQGVRVALFAVSDRPVRVPGAEAVLEGSAPGDAAAAEAAAAALEGIDFAGDQNAGPALKRHLAGVVLRRALMEAAA